MKKLLIPYHARQCLAQDTVILDASLGQQSFEKSIRFRAAQGKNLIMMDEWLGAAERATIPSRPYRSVPAQS